MQIEELVDLVAAKVASRLGDRLAQDCSGKIKPRLMTVEQAGAYLGRTPDAIRHLLSSGKLPQVRGDRRIFIDVADLDRWIEANKA